MSGKSDQASSNVSIDEMNCEEAVKFQVALLCSWLT
jgi:hypothetical protein